MTRWPDESIPRSLQLPRSLTVPLSRSPLPRRMVKWTAVRQRFRVGDQLFAAETFRIGREYEVRVFLIRPSDSYFKKEKLKAILSFRGAGEQELMRQAVSRMKGTAFGVAR